MNCEMKKNNETKQDQNDETNGYSVIDNYNKKYLKTCIHDIKNGKSFTIETLHRINQLSYDSRIEILETYNEMIGYLTRLLLEEN